MNKRGQDELWRQRALLDDSVVQHYCRSGQTIIREHRKLYGSAFRWEGVVGMCVQALACATRLRHLVIKNPEIGKRKKMDVRNLLQDMHNYAILGLTLLDEDNWDGGEF